MQKDPRSDVVEGFLAELALQFGNCLFINSWPPRTDCFPLRVHFRAVIPMNGIVGLRELPDSGTTGAGWAVGPRGAVVPCYGVAVWH